MWCGVCGICVWCVSVCVRAHACVCVVCKVWCGMVWCVFVSIRVYVYVYMYLYMHTCMSMSMCLHACVHAYIHGSVCLLVCLCLYILYANACTCESLYSHMHLCKLQDKPIHSHPSDIQ